MANIRIQPLSESLKVSTDEIEKTFGFHDQSHGKEDLYVLGAPGFRMPFKKGDGYFAPAGQSDLLIRVFRKIRNRSQMVSQLKKEHAAIVSALDSIGVDFQILSMERAVGNLLNTLTQKGPPGFKLSVGSLPNWFVFPRDIAVFLKRSGVLLLNSSIFSFRTKRIDNCSVISSVWGEGGRVLFSDNIMIVGKKPDGRVREQDVLTYLKKRGMKISVIPFPVAHSLSWDGRITEKTYSSHLDRAGCLLKGKGGGFYLVLDPTYQTGAPESPLSPSRSSDIVKKACEKIGVEVRLPKKVSVPYSLNAVQFHNGKVLATAGDENTLSVLSDIVGKENLFTTEIPIALYPSCARAGIRCLMNDGGMFLMERFLNSP